MDEFRFDQLAFHQGRETLHDGGRLRAGGLASQRGIQQPFDATVHRLSGSIRDLAEMNRPAFAIESREDQPLESGLTVRRDGCHARDLSEKRPDGSG